MSIPCAAGLPGFDRRGFFFDFAFELPFFFAMLLTLGLGFCAFGPALFFAVLDVAGPGLATVATSAPFRVVMWSLSVL